MYYGAIYNAELDPLGSNVGLSSPTANYAAGPNTRWGDPFGGYSCRMDEFEVPCSQVMHALSSGYGILDSRFDNYYAGQIGIHETKEWIKDSGRTPPRPARPGETLADAGYYRYSYTVWGGFSGGFGRDENVEPLPPPPPPDKPCDSWVSTYYSTLKSSFDALWQKHLNTISKENPNGLEQGGLISLHPERINPANRQEETAFDYYDGGGETENGMPDAFDQFILKTKNTRSKDGWRSTTAHVHPPNPDEKKPSPGDFRNAPKNNVDAIITEKTIILYDGNGTYKKQNFIRCEIDRATGKSRKIG